MMNEAKAQELMEQLSDHRRTMASQLATMLANIKKKQAEVDRMHEQVELQFAEIDKMDLRIAALREMISFKDPNPPPEQEGDLQI